MFSVYFEYPIYFLFITLAFSLGVTALLYYRNKKNKEVKKSVLFSLAALRFIFCFLISSLLLKPILKLSSIFEERPIIVFAQDNSKSIILNKDSSYYKTDYIKDIEKIRNSLSEKYDFRFEKFPNDNDNDSTIDFSGEKTNISDFLSIISKKYSGQNLAGILLASDGLYNEGNNPAYNSSLSCPIYSLALGDTLPQKDILISEVINNKNVFLGNTFPVTLIIKSVKATEKETELTIINDNQVVYSSKVELTQNSESKTINLDLKANKIGAQQYTVKLAAISDEISYENNILKFVINVIDSRKKILLLANAPHPDLGAIKSALKENPDLELDIEYANTFNESTEKYDLIILHQLPSNKNNINNIIDEISKNNSSVLYIIGNSSLLSYFKKSEQGLEIIKMSNSSDYATVSLNPEFSTFSLDISEDFYKYLSPLNVSFGNYSLEANAKVLFYQTIKNVKTSKPMIAFLERENNKTAFIIGDGLWKWRLDDFQNSNEHSNFNTLINKIIQYLIVERVKDKLSLDYKQIYSDAESINIYADFYNENYEPTQNLEITLKLINEEGKEYKYNFETLQNKYRCIINKLKEGSYKFVVTTTYDGKEYSKEGNFIVQKTNIESLITTANHSVLHLISEKTGGKVYSPKEIDKIIKEINENEGNKTISVFRNELLGISDLYILFFIILIFATIEWSLRKYFGI